MPLTPEQVNEAGALYTGGLSLREVALRLGVSSSTVHRALTAAGVVTRRPGPEPASEKTRKQGRVSPTKGREDEVVAHYRRHGSLMRAARDFGSTPATIRRVLESAGVRIIPNKGGRPGRRKELLDQARSVELEVAEGRTCEYRPPHVGTSSALLAPACGRPVLFAGGREALCEVHAVLAKDFASTPEEIAQRQRESLTVRCACGWSCESTALRSSAVFAYHRAHDCPLSASRSAA